MNRLKSAHGIAFEKRSIETGYNKIKLYYTTPIKLTQQKCDLFDVSNNFDIYLVI